MAQRAGTIDGAVSLDTIPQRLSAHGGAPRPAPISRGGPHSWQTRTDHATVKSK